MPWWLWLVPIAGIFFFLSRRQTKPQYHEHVPFQRLTHFVERLVEGHKSNSVMLVEREKAAGLLQVKLKDVAGTGVTVEIGMPEVDWSIDVFDELESRLRDLGFTTRIGSGRGCSTVRRFLRATISGEDKTAVGKIARGIAEVGACLGWEAASFTLHYEVNWQSKIE